MLEEYEKEIKHLRQELKLQDALSGKRDVTYEPMTESQVRHLQEQLGRYVEGELCTLIK